MKHIDISEMLSAFANDEVSRTQREFIEEHLTTCLECRDELADYRAVKTQLTALSEFSTPDTMGDAAMTAIRTQALMRPSFSRFVRSVPVAGAVAAAIVIALVIVFSNGEGQSAIARAYDAVSDLESYRMTGTTTVIDGGQNYETGFDWTFDGENRTSGTFSGPGGEIEFFIDGDTQYVRADSDTGAVGTTVVLENSLLSPVPTREGTLRFLESLTNITELSAETVNNVPSLRYTGNVDLGPEFDRLLAEADLESEQYEFTKAFTDIQRQSEISVELWIGEDDYRVQRMVIDARLASASSMNGVIEFSGWTTFKTVANYTEFNAPVKIAPPLTPAGKLEPGWLSTGSGQSPAPETSLEVR